MQTREEVAESLCEASSLIAAEADSRLFPEGGIRIGYALPGAVGQEEICAVEDGILHGMADCFSADIVRFGADVEVARVILTVIRHDGRLRSAAALRCTEEILRCATEGLVLDAAVYPPSPPGSGVMDWGVEACCRDGVPDVVYGQKTFSKDVILWIIGETPAELARNIIMLSGCISYTS